MPYGKLDAGSRGGIAVEDRRRLIAGQKIARPFGLIAQACVDGAPESEWP
ncbi:MAG: hypothetical protein [Olavius algarvensis Gamma 1 endosymbiont]|nr:MAG: hypothetical protein [Olavius algarvensis Gamma 1 endosymbiont]